MTVVHDKRQRAAALAKRVTVGIVTAMPKEHVAVKAMLDRRVDHGDYVLGEVPAKGGGTHAVALVRSGMGTTLAATRTVRLLDGMQEIDAVLMVGIAGGVPSPGDPWSHVRLGDVAAVRGHRGRGLRARGAGEDGLEGPGAARRGREERDTEQPAGEEPDLPGARGGGPAAP